MSDPRGSTHTKRATYELRQRIVQGEFAGGTRLYEVALAEDLNISRTPVREAMSRLAEEGLLERAPGGGFTVRSFTYRDAIDAIELRGVLEGTAARIAAEQGVPAEKLQDLKDIVARSETCFVPGNGLMDFDRYSELNAMFHDRLADLCDSPIIQRELDRVKSLPFASPSAFVLGHGENAITQSTLVTAQAQHRAIVAAIEAREGARAEALAREHARIARENLAQNRAGGDSVEFVPGFALIVD